MTIQTYADVTFPFDTEMTQGVKVRLLAAVVNDYATHIIGYTYYDDPNTDCSQVLEWDGAGKFGGGKHPEMNLVPPPGAVEGELAAINDEIAKIRRRLADNPDAPAEWRSADERRLRSLERSAGKLLAPHIWDRAA